MLLESGGRDASRRLAILGHGLSLSELEGVLAAQMVATHSAAMECYRRAMLPDQTFEGCRENLNSHWPSGGLLQTSP
jgi:hypothetical protein